MSLDVGTPTRGRFFEGPSPMRNELTPGSVGTPFRILQAFEGVVETVEGDAVCVTLRDLTNVANGDETAVLSLEAFDHQDQIVPGALFFMTIGYRESRAGRETVTKLDVRRLPTPSPQQRLRAEREVRAWRAVVEERRAKLSGGGSASG